jgi:cyanophycinase
VRINEFTSGILLFVFNYDVIHCYERKAKKNTMGSHFMQNCYLFLIGGAEDRKGDKLVLKHLVDQTHPDNIIVIPTASAYPRDIYRSYTDAFRNLGINEVNCLDIRHKEEADRAENIEAIEKADMVYFGGGDQAKLVDTLIRTEFLNRIRARFEAGDLNIAGTSAGASAIGNPIFYNGDRKGLQKGSIKSSEGLGFIDGVAIDTHFSTRKRLSRLCQFLICGKCTKGIGLDEDTGIMVYHNLHFKVIGSGMVTVVNSANVTGSNYTAISNGEKLRFNNMRVGFLPAGSMFSIKNWSILNRAEHKNNRPTTRKAS